MYSKGHIDWIGPWTNQGLDGKYPRQPTDVIPKFDVDLDVITDHYTRKTSLPVAAAFHGFPPAMDGGEKPEKYDVRFEKSFTD